MRKWLFLIACLSVSIPLPADSLWTPDFRGYLSGQSRLSPGDLLVVVIDTSTSLAVTATRTDGRNVTFEFSGGEAGGLFSFLPAANTGQRLNTNSDESVELRGEIVVRVMETDEAGNARVSGTRQTELGGSRLVLTLDGYVSPRYISQDGSVPFSRVAEARLLYSGVLDAGRTTLSEADIREILPAVTAALATPTATTPTATTPTATTPTATIPAPATTAAAASATTNASGTATASPSTSAATTLALTEQRKRELLLSFLNLFVDFLFQNATAGQ